MIFKKYYSLKGFTIIESLIGVAVFIIIAVSIYQVYIATMNNIYVSRLKVVAAALATEQFEIIRNLSYSDVGVVGGIPNGRIPFSQNFVRDGSEFLVKTTIRNIDDPFDGVIGGAPNDLSPADYRLVELEISCSFCRNFQPLYFTTHVGPRALEAASTNGSLFVRVFDAVGQPVIGAQVHIENNKESPAIVIDDITNNNGLLQIVDAPPGIEAYEITVSKIGYSTDKTYQTGGFGNPNPIKPHATVALQELTQISFAIDKTSVFDISSVTDTCNPTPSIDFSLTGSKLIGITPPDVLKYDVSHITDSFGKKLISNLEWDTYNFNITDSLYDLAGTIPLLPFTINPNASQNFKLIVAPKNPNGILITVKDSATQLSLSDATVRLERTGYDTTLTTGRGFIRQTDWSGGDGQADFIDQTKYFNSDGNIETNNPAGELDLKKIFGEYRPLAELVSSTFDTGSASNFHQILWQPQNQPPDTGSDSVKFQVSTNNDKATWNFLGPDGTVNTYYTLADQNINGLHNGGRYFRYKAFLQTASTTWTPTISDILFTFTSSCVPPGQVFFGGLANGNYTLTVSKTGYQPFSDSVVISSSWKQYEVILSP